MSNFPFPASSIPATELLQSTVVLYYVPFIRNSWKRIDQGEKNLWTASFSESKYSRELKNSLPFHHRPIRSVTQILLQFPNNTKLVISIAWKEQLSTSVPMYLHGQLTDRKNQELTICPCTEPIVFRKRGTCAMPGLWNLSLMFTSRWSLITAVVFPNRVTTVSQASIILTTVFISGHLTLEFEHKEISDTLWDRYSRDYPMKSFLLTRSA